MPYLGRDWRSPGDEWVRTNQGWEKLRLWRVKVFENLNSHFISRLLRLAFEEWDKECEDLRYVHQPYIRFIKCTSKERKELTSISEALLHLDISTAGRDLRRFNYVCKMLRILLCDKLPSLSGTAQKYIFNIMEEMVNHVIKSQYNVGEMRMLVNFAANSLKENHFGHIGSSCLWNSHCQAVNRMSTKLCKFRVMERSEDGKLTFSDLPEECVFSILSKIPDHADILHLGQTNTNYNDIANDRLLWKQMCLFNFSKRQLLTFINQNEDEYQNDWKYIYKKCCLRFGRKEIYADMIAICCNCSHLFWQSLGHPCTSKLSPRHTTLKPEEFIRLFQF